MKIIIIIFITLIFLSCLNIKEIEPKDQKEVAGFMKITKIDCSDIWAKEEKCGTVYLTIELWGDGSSMVFVPNGTCCKE